ncbi:hypothetical protein BURPSS13_C0153 [Burkholderia pseudomallei S13]|nr:hypothetical protein BURPSS13_C0153 [Burkholderia pseudomallei S13]
MNSSVRLQTQNFAAGVTMRRQPRACGERAAASSSNACASRMKSTVAASDSSARSASTLRISG